MNIRFFILPLLIIALQLNAQDKGIHFEHGLSWNEVKAKAKKENKFIFMDCYSTWCGPCKMMSSDIFPQEQVGTFFNNKFVNVKVQMDKTAGDDEWIKKWYNDASLISKKYNVMAYPTFLYFSPDGALVHLQVGGSDNAETFIALSAKALNPETQYYTRMAAIAKGAGKDTALLKSLAIEAQKNYDGQYSNLFSRRYLQAVPDIFTPDIIRFIHEFTRSSRDTGFTIFRKNTAKIDKLMGAGYAGSKVEQIIMSEEIYSKLDEETTPDVNKLEHALKQKYPEYADVIIGKLKLQMYQRDDKREQYCKTVQAFVKKYGRGIGATELNDFARTLGAFTNDTKLLNLALSWSDHAIKQEPSPEFQVTRAGLLYKQGKVDDAIRLQQSAINSYKRNEETEYMIEYYEKILEKMKKRELLN